MYVILGTFTFSVDRYFGQPGGVYCILCVLSREITRLATLWQSECRTRGRTSVILTNRNPLQSVPEATFGRLFKTLHKLIYLLHMYSYTILFQ